MQDEFLRASVVNEELRVKVATTEDAAVVRWNGHATNTIFVFGLHFMNWCRALCFFIIDIVERPQTNSLISATRDDVRPVSGEFHGEDKCVSDEIVALEESRLMLTSGSETVFSKRWNAAIGLERSSSDCWCCSGHRGSLWGFFLFLWHNNGNLQRGKTKNTFCY